MSVRATIQFDLPNFFIVQRSFHSTKGDIVDITTQEPLREAINALEYSALTNAAASKPSPSKVLATSKYPNSMMDELLIKLRSAYRGKEGAVTELQLTDRLELSIKKLGRGAILELAVVDFAANDIEPIWEGYRAYPKGALKAIADAVGSMEVGGLEMCMPSAQAAELHSGDSRLQQGAPTPHSLDKIWSPILVVVGWKAKRTQARNDVEIAIDEVASSEGRFRATLRYWSEKSLVNYYDQEREAKEQSLKLAVLLLDFAD